MKINQLDRQNLQLLRSEIDGVLKSIGDKYGLVFKTGNASFTANNANFKLECATTGDNGSVHSKDAETFKLYANIYGLKESDLGRKVTLQGSEYVIVGLKPRSVHPIIAARVSDAKLFKLSLTAVQSQLTSKP